MIRVTIVKSHRRTLLCSRHLAILAETAVAREWQIADPLAGGGENRIAKRGDEGRYSWLADASGRRAALGNIDVGLSRHLVDTGHRVVIEVRLLDHSILGSDLSAAHNARAEN